MNKKIYEVPKRALLIIAGIVWMIAGFNVVRLGIISYKLIDMRWYLPILSVIIFILFGMMFYKMTQKHCKRIMNYEETYRPIWNFFDVKAYIIMAVMMGGGIGLRNAGVFPDVFVAFFYTGLGCALFLAGVCFVIMFFRKNMKNEFAPYLKDGRSPFFIKEIDDELFARMKGKSYKDNCTLPREELRYLHVLHKDLRGNTHEGEMVVNKRIAQIVLELLRELYEADYPIEKMKLIDEYEANDELSMRDNNSSSFNFRYISYTTKISNHGYGLAIDINPLYNPYVKIVDGKLDIEPATAEPYVDRDKQYDYKIDEEDLAYKLFTKAGFEWGGNWTDEKDYQHFEMPIDSSMSSLNNKKILPQV